MRQSNQKVAAYNLGVAQGVRDAKQARNNEFIVSFCVYTYDMNLLISTQ